mmetsp:Transcript_9559/g.23950  ORF Transcript_9559/g.23950 Transcript_9559/m.23950 type:complete len:921 (-) Transcript_9559:278-3040(-)|eukprot:CAMPEP_0177634610 /NCGR_PEP_ID=MMETSP0447-20121125/3459_1 /TAXON_ID=0 /ORGANISM="Stygamoeba regulata, Strain BSH-02190019" /LENGTH=920 /DNA_ID=CAMNT_0019136341 /DNA_START=1365 /DNA_END=4127 /DNA_ORIENTATION=-
MKKKETKHSNKASDFVGGVTASIFKKKEKDDTPKSKEKVGKRTPPSSPRNKIKTLTGHILGKDKDKDKKKSPRAEEDEEDTVISQFVGKDLTEIPHDLLQSKDRVINVSNNKISALPPDLNRLASVTEMDLSSNCLRIIPAEFGMLTNLTSLDLSHNRITLLPHEISNLTSLKAVTLAHNRVAHIPDSLATLTRITHLSLRCNCLIKLPPSFGKLVRLKVVDLQNNFLVEIPPCKKLQRLLALDMRNNQLTSVPDTILHCTSLKELYIGHNQLREFPSSLAQLSNLQKLHMEGNHIASLPPVHLQGFPALTTLNLCHNRLVTLPPCTGDLVTLEVLLLQSNDLSDLPLELGNLTNLRELDLRANPPLAERRFGSGGWKKIIPNLLSLRNLRLGEVDVTQKLNAPAQPEASEEDLESKVGRSQKIDPRESVMLKDAASIASFFANQPPTEPSQAKDNGSGEPVEESGGKPEADKEREEGKAPDGDAQTEAKKERVRQRHSRPKKNSTLQRRHHKTVKAGDFHEPELPTLQGTELDELRELCEVAELDSLKAASMDVDYDDLMKNLMNVGEAPLSSRGAGSNSNTMGRSRSKIDRAHKPSSKSALKKRKSFTNMYEIKQDITALEESPEPAYSVSIDMSTSVLEGQKEEHSVIKEWAVAADMNKAGLMRKKGRIEKAPLMQEDAYMCVPKMGVASHGSHNHALFGVCDGHAGAAAALSAKILLPEELAHQAQAYKTDTRSMLHVGFLTTDEKMAKHECEGCTCTAVYFWKNKDGRFLQAANVGDSSAFLCRGGKAIPLSVDHKLTNRDEFQRIKNLGINLSSGQTRINGLGVTRALGDHFAKDTNSGMCAVPYVSDVYQIKEQDKFVVIASDGLWDVISGQKAIDSLLRSELTCEEMACKLLKTALESVKCQDNVTVVVVML